MSTAEISAATCRITLTRHELEIAAAVGVRRQISALCAGRPVAHGYEGDGWSVHIEGAAGEMALARFLGRYWDGSVDTFRRSADVGTLEVRTRSSHSYDLLVRPDDDPTRYFALVTGRSPSYWVRGFLLGAHARRDEWWQDHGGRPPAWFVPVTALRTDWPLR